MEEQRAITSLEAAISSIKAEIEGVRELFMESDRRYIQRFDLQDKAVSAALVAQEKAVSAALAAAEKAVSVAEQNSEKWRSNANEWRGAMDDREMKMVMKEHLNPVIGGLQKEVNELKTLTTLSTGKGQGLDKAWAIILGLFGAGGGGLIGFLVSHYSTKK